VRITVNTPEAAQAVPHIREQLDRMGIDVPLIGDFHYNGHRLLTEFPGLARRCPSTASTPATWARATSATASSRRWSKPRRGTTRPVRIGVNWGSLDQELLASLMDENARRAAPWDAKQVMYQALVQSALSRPTYAREVGLTRTRSSSAARSAACRT
jgi:(E)-4-hydroxy-3-methylbut-2-enyl-diphosphate synthase